MKKSLEEKLKYAVENHKLKYEKYFGKGSKWYRYYLEIWELVWVRNFIDGYQILSMIAKTEKNIMVLLPLIILQVPKIVMGLFQG